MKKASQIFIGKGCFILLGLWCVFCIFLFLHQLDLFSNVALKLKVNSAISAIIFVITTGFGINIGIRLLYGDIDAVLLKASLVFSIYYMLLESILTITPSATYCHCISWREAIINIQDWSRVEYAAILLLINLLLWAIMKKRFVCQEI